MPMYSEFSVSSLAPIDCRKWRIMFFVYGNIAGFASKSASCLHGSLMKFLYGRYAVQQNLLQVHSRHFDSVIGGIFQVYCAGV